MKKIINIFLVVILIVLTGYTASQSRYNTITRDMLLDGVYGGIHVHDNSTSQSIASGATYTKITAFNNNDTISNHMTPDSDNNKITITENGNYSVIASVNFRDGANITWWATIFVDGSEQDEAHLKRKMGATGDVGSGCIVGTFSVTNAPIDVDLRMRHDNVAAQNVVVSYSNIFVRLEGL